MEKNIGIYQELSSKPTADILVRMQEIVDCQEVEWVTDWAPRVFENEQAQRTDWLRYGRKIDDMLNNHPGFTQIIEWRGQMVESHEWTFLVDEDQLETAISRHISISN